MSANSLTAALRETLTLFDSDRAPVTTTEVAERLDLGRRATYERLDRLAERGELETKKVGASGRIWWRPVSVSVGDGEGKADGCEIGDVDGDETYRRLRETDWSETSLGPLERWPRSLQSAADIALTAKFPTVLAWGSALTCVYNDAFEGLFPGGTDPQGRSLVDVWPTTDPDIKPVVNAALSGERTALENVSVSLEGDDGPCSLHLDCSVVPVHEATGSTGGVLVTAVDITERVRAENRFRESEERLRLALEAGDIGAWELDLRTESAPIRSPQHDRIFGYEEPLEDWGFEQFLEHVHPEDRERVSERFEAAFETGHWSFECRINRVDGSQRWIDANGEFYFDEGGDPIRAVGNVQDVTERKIRENALEAVKRQYQTLVEHFPNGVVALVDDTFRYASFGGTLEGDVDMTRSDLQGEPVREVLPQRVADVVVPRYEAAFEGNPSKFEETIDGMVYQFHFVPVRDDDGDVFAVMAISQEITEQKSREAQLHQAKTQLEAATEAGAVATWQWHVESDRLVAGPSFAGKFGVDPELVREGVSLDRLISAIDEADRDRVVARIEAAVDSCGEYSEEYRVWDANGERRWVIARGTVNCDDDGNVVSFPGVLVDITERKRAERALERNRNQLEVLNNLNGVVRKITDAVIEQSSRQEIERTVCEQLATSDSYAFAWIGSVDLQTQTVNPQTVSGIDENASEFGFPDLSDDSDNHGPIKRAISDREMQVTRNVDANSHPCPALTLDQGIESSAIIPISHEGTLYGLLNVCTRRQNAFTDEERPVIGQLGEVVGHAIAAIERQRALMSDEVIELEFTIANVFDQIDVPLSVDGAILFERTVPARDGAYLEYGTATGGAFDAVETLVDTEDAPHWESVRLLGTDGDTSQFELTLADPPIYSSIASYGGYIDAARIEDGDCDMRIHLPPNTDVAQIVDSFRDAYPEIELTAQRQVPRSQNALSEITTTLFDRLTDRQRAAIEAAYFAGYFEWPRDASGEDMADSFGVSGATYHQHLRNAQQKIFQEILGDR